MTEDGTGQIIYSKKTKKTVPPDTGAAMAWLKNRRPDKWRDKQDVEISSPNLIVEVRDSNTKIELDKLKNNLS